MQAIAETLFDIGYLISVITIGGMMIGKSNGKKEYRLFGIMAVILGVGDSFHLVPRIYALCTTGLENYTALLGAGKFVTSITMTIFYVLFYQVWRIRYRINGKRELTILVYFLAALRILLCLMPQNQWTSPSAPLSWVFTGIFPLLFWAFASFSCFIKAPVKPEIRIFAVCGLLFFSASAFIFLLYSGPILFPWLEC